MSPKERLLAAIRGQEVDRVPWAPFLAYFWQAQPKEIQERGQLEFLEGIGADPLLRGFYRLFSIKRKRCEIRQVVRGNERVTYYETPVGTLQAKHIYSPNGDTWFTVGHPVKTKEDFKILTYINEDMIILENKKSFEEEYRRIEERGLIVPIIGTESKSSFQSLIEYWVGTEELVYALMDYPETVESCLYVMQQNSIESVKISVDSSAEAFIFWEDSSTTNISPHYFEKYISPEINSWGKEIHKAGKQLIHHACGHLRDLLPLMGKTEIDMIESISPPPTGNIELWEARDILPQHIGLIGGIEPTVFLNSTLEELEEYVVYLLDRVGTYRYIIANSDSCPPGVSIEKFKLVTDIVNRG